MILRPSSRCQYIKREFLKQSWLYEVCFFFNRTMCLANMNFFSFTLSSILEFYETEMKKNGNTYYWRRQKAISQKNVSMHDSVSRTFSEIFLCIVFFFFFHNSNSLGLFSNETKKKRYDFETLEIMLCECNLSIMCVS